MLGLKLIRVLVKGAPVICTQHPSGWLLTATSPVVRLSRCRWSNHEWYRSVNHANPLQRYDLTNKKPCALFLGYTEKAYSNEGIVQTINAHVIMYFTLWWCCVSSVMYWNTCQWNWKVYLLMILTCETSVVQEYIRRNLMPCFAMF